MPEAEKPFIVVPVPLGAVASTNERAVRPARNLGEFLYKGIVWRSTGAASLVVAGDLGSARPIDFVGMMGANALAATTIRVRLADTAAAAAGASASYDSGVLPFISPAVTRTDGVYHSHLKMATVQTRRFWQIDIAGHTGDFEASMLVLGKRVEPARYYETTWKTGTRDLGSISFGRNGVPGVTLGAKLRTLDYTLGWGTEAEAETMLAPLDDLVGRTAPFLTCFDPAPTIYRQRRTFFGFNEEQPSIGKVGFNRFERNFQLLSLW